MDIPRANGKSEFCHSAIFLLPVFCFINEKRIKLTLLSLYALLQNSC
ncbi:hypothetical protein CHK_2272 [Christensenella hongkongensis]|uniref:Uncharacterized protein n=1 Tax=Christensenella hongkongensis TaxID=270498 RepID=A0A0M2NCI8_9FIRM|nr:hypothetical protein CHK_2272 [Christensenella hongkongensis]